MNHSESLNLKNLVNDNDWVDNTNNIRSLKHSVLIRNDVRTLNNLKKTDLYLKLTEPSKFMELCQKEANFLFNNYTDIFNKVVKDEIDLRILTQLLMVLKMIEDDQVDQHEGSVMVGKILKELYVDSAMKRAENLDKEHENDKVSPIEGKPISWKQFKAMNI